MTILKLAKANTSTVLREVLEGLKRGKVFVCPTDTVYGLVARTQDRSAMERIFQIKGRGKRKPFPVFIKAVM